MRMFRTSSLAAALAVGAGMVGLAQDKDVSPSVAPKRNPAGPAGPSPGPVNYQGIGTNIDCLAQRPDGGFQLLITVEDTSVYTNMQDATTPTAGDMPVFRSFRSTNTLVLKDGQSREFTAATDRVSGEVVRIPVTLRVVK